ncbi:MAG: ATP-dependent sacrificial sulfur transferase LarE [Candidatus Aminicenantales bacterium]
MRDQKMINSQPLSIPKKIMTKYEKLKKLLSTLGGAVVAYSGGVDSTLLLRIARDVLGDKVVAVVASSETYPESEVKAALRLARRMGVRVRQIKTEELANPSFSSNPPERCYYCKQELFSALKEVAAEEGLPYVLDGANWDDRRDFRPGSKAARELGVRSPLQEVGLNKEEVRLLSRWLGLETWDKPSLACLASRFPYSVAINPENLQKVGQAELWLRKAGFRQVRVRHHGDEIARIEVMPEELSLFFDSRKRKRLVRRLKSLGYTYITLDLEGYRSGSMNELLKKGKSFSA